MPEQAFDQFDVKSFNAQQSQAEIKGLDQVERVHKMYLAMLQIGAEVRRVKHDPTKTQANVDNVYQTQSIQNLPAQEDLQSALTSDVPSLQEHL